MVVCEIYGPLSTLIHCAVTQVAQEAEHGNLQLGGPALRARSLGKEASDIDIRPAWLYATAMAPTARGERDDWIDRNHLDRAEEPLDGGGLSGRPRGRRGPRGGGIEKPDRPAAPCFP